MSDDARPLLAFNSPSVGERVKPGGHPPKVVGPGGRRQDERLSPRFKELTDAFEAKRAELGEGTPIEAVAGDRAGPGRQRRRILQGSE